MIECVPNVSEGRRADVIAALGAAIAGPGVHVLDQSSDPSHNRTVYTFAGDAGPIQDAVLRLFAAAVEAIDLRAHDGVHPRIGAVDVVPFVPLQGATIEQCVALAKSTAALVAERLHVPVFLYEEAATDDARRSLSDIRRGGVNGVAHRMKQSAWRPDYGPASTSSDGRRHRDRRAPGPDCVQREPRVQSPGRREAHRLGHPRKQRRARPRQSSGPAARPWHRPGVDEPYELQRDVDDHGVRCRNARGRGRTACAYWKAKSSDWCPLDALPADPARRLKLRAQDLDRVLERRLETKHEETEEPNST